jgi:hypothetical protein
MRVFAVGRADLPPIEMPARFKHDIAYFMTPGGEPGVPPLEPGEFWVRRADAERWLDEGVLTLISPLDSEKHTEVEISDDQQRWLEWLLEHQVEHVRLVS